MDVASKLRAVFWPGDRPAILSHPGSPRPAGTGTPDFAGTLAKANLTDESIGAFGARRPRPAETAAVPSIHVGRATDGLDTGPASRPTVGPGLPPDPFDLPIDDQRIELNDTLETVLIRERGTRGSNPTQPPEADLPTPPVAITPRTPMAVAGAPDELPTTPVLILPPIGFLWPAAALRGSGASGPGVDGTDAGAARILVDKHETYNHPDKYGMILNPEARLFLDAVDKGYVPNTPEGLGTLLGQLGKGAIGATARPAPMTEYFRQFFASS